MSEVLLLVFSIQIDEDVVFLPSFCCLDFLKIYGTICTCISINCYCQIKDELILLLLTMVQFCCLIFNHIHVHVGIWREQQPRHFNF